ncbi:hypothetical protein [Methanoregula sp.]|uniref:hypothetical protein n=1 Tax=Methanoregula sp. TaxID=2052170 RepID=UPI002CD96CB7|nr:hypothetical protein [Methanoregula sp.]HVP96575.1 hypothetical protein [Methanoregula sp.]
MTRTEQFLTGIIIVMLAIAIVAGYLYATRQSVVVPHIAVGSDDGTSIMATHTFPFEKNTITISVPVDAAVYHAAKTTDKSISIYGNVTESVWVTDSYREMVNDPAQDPMYTDLLIQFQKIRNDEGLSSDEYLELMAAYTQSLTYETTPDNPTKYPVETVVEGAGDCDDKSVLLAGLLSREGYNVSLLLFSPESHMALGIGSPDSLYKDTGYAYLETTNFSYVGVPPDDLEGGVVLTSEPLVIPVGNGTTLYTSGAQTTYIHDMFSISGQKVAALNAQLVPIASDLTAKQDQISEIESRMEALRSSGNIGGYNALVSSHNAQVSVYNAELSTYRGEVAQGNAYAEVYNDILTHAYDRKGTYIWVKANMPQ